MTPKKLGPKGFVKIGPVTAEILLIWTGHMLPGQMSPYQLASFKHGPKIPPLKFGENWISKS